MLKTQKHTAENSSKTGERVKLHHQDSGCTTRIQDTSSSQHNTLKEENAIGTRSSK
jgi:hypothetical protein